MIASRWLDPVLGIDMHSEIVPTPAPVPMPFPHPFIGIVQRQGDDLRGGRRAARAAAAPDRAGVLLGIRGPFEADMTLELSLED